MTSQYLKADLERDEGWRNRAYLDSASPANWTIGIGHKLPSNPLGAALTWNEDQINSTFGSDVDRTTKGLMRVLPWFYTLSDIRQDCLVNMAFNLGVGGLLKFTTFLGLMAQGKYAEAALDLRGTLWFKQVGQRAVRIVQQLSTDTHQE